MENLSKTYLMVDRITNYIKIGKSKDVFYREKTLQAEKPTIEGLFYVEEDIEKLLHFLFAEKRLRGEWFNLNQEDIDCIDQILAQKGLIKKEFSLNDVVKVRPKKRNYETVSKRPQSEIIYESQHNTDVVILNSPLSAPKLVRKLDNGKDIQFSEIYTPKIFYDIISRITPEYLQALEDGKEPLLITIYIGAFLNSISPGKSNSLYRHVIDCIDLLQTTQVKWKDTEKEKGTAIITHYEYHPRQGKVDIVLYKEFVKQVVLVTQNEHFSFLKKHLNQLQNAQAIRLFPFFVSWSNKGMIEMNLDVFKNLRQKDFGRFQKTHARRHIYWKIYRNLSRKI